MSTATPEHPRSVVAAGYVPLDIVSYQRNVWHAAGGTAGNVAAILGFLGWNASVVADLGNDLAGGRIRRDLQKANVAVDHIRLVSGVTSPRLVHQITATGHRYQFRCPCCAQAFPMSRPLRTDRARELVAAFTAAPDVFFVDRLNAGTIILAEHFKKNGSRVVFEPSRPSRPDLLERIASIADVIKHADDRMIGVEPRSGRNSQVQIITSGAQGARYRIGRGAWRQSPAFSYPVVDAGGAGDWTTAGLVHALPVAGRPTAMAVGNALRWAQALAAVSCGAPGARGLAKWQSAEAVLRSASFLEQRKDSSEQEALRPLAATTAPASVCGWCLLPRAASSAGSGLSAGAS